MAEPSISAAELIKREKQEVAALKGVLEDAVNQREKHYDKVFTFSVTFEADNTFAVRDTHNFQQMLKMLGLPKALELVLEAEDPTPAWTMIDMLQRLWNKTEDSNIRCLIIGHYAGHACLNSNGRLIFYASDPVLRTMRMDQTFERLCEEGEAFSNSDVILILDSCFAGAEARGIDIRDRSVEIIASVGHDQPALRNSSDNARIQNRTFTSRLADEVAKRIGREDVSSISFAEIVGELRKKGNPDRLPQYYLRVGRVGVRISKSSKIPPHLRTHASSESSSMQHQRFTTSDSSTSSTAPTSQPMIAMFKVHLENTNAESPEVLKLVQWIHSLDLNIGLQLSGVYMSRSTELLFMAPWFLWAQLSPRKGFSLVCETLGPNILPAMMSRFS